MTSLNLNWAVKGANFNQQSIRLKSCKCKVVDLNLQLCHLSLLRRTPQSFEDETSEFLLRTNYYRGQVRPVTRELGSHAGNLRLELGLLGCIWLVGQLKEDFVAGLWLEISVVDVSVSTDSSGQVHVLLHDSHSVGMDGAKVGVLEDAHDVGL